MTKKNAVIISSPSKQLKAVLAFINKVRIPTLSFLLATYSVAQRILARRGIEYYLVERDQSKKARSPNPAFERAVQLLGEAVDIQIAVGEAGHRLMENEYVLAAIKAAYEQNDATIEIIHGPRVDTETITIFELAQKNIASVYRMLEYAQHHFILIREKSGRTTLIDEGTHNEAIWYQENPQSAPKELFPSLARFYYITDRADRVIDARRREFERRKARSQLVTKHPAIDPQQDYYWLSYLFDALITLPIRHALQPLSILLNRPIDTRFLERYKGQKGMKEDETSDSSLFQEDGRMYDSKKTPPKVKVWLANRIREITESSSRPEVTPRQTTKTPWQLPGGSFSMYTTSMFRDLHSIALPDDSIGMLGINDTLFFELVSRNTWTVEELKRNLQNEEFMSSLENAPKLPIDWKTQLRIASI